MSNWELLNRLDNISLNIHTAFMNYIFGVQNVDTGEVIIVTDFPFKDIEFIMEKRNGERVETMHDDEGIHHFMVFNLSGDFRKVEVFRIADIDEEEMNKTIRDFYDYPQSYITCTFKWEKRGNELRCFYPSLKGGTKKQYEFFHVIPWNA